MSYCTSCGHELGAGRFCTNCGRPVAPPPPPPSSAPPPPPQAGQVPPPPPRYPLFADELEPPAYAAPEPPLPHHRRPRPVWPFVVAALTLLLVIAVLVGVAALSDDDGGSSADPTHAASKSPRGGQGSATPGGGNLAAGSTVQVPATAPPNQDVSGNPTTYVGANMLDGVPETCWRMPGDGTGDEITVTLPQETHLSRIGLINGYAKIAKDAQGKELDWYHGNRRILTVEWLFDDGTTLIQDLEDTVSVQSVDVDVTTTTVVLRLVSVSDPGTGRAARNYTAISDLSFVGG